MKRRVRVHVEESDLDLFSVRDCQEALATAYRFEERCNAPLGVVEEITIRFIPTEDEQEQLVEYEIKIAPFKNPVEKAVLKVQFANDKYRFREAFGAHSSDWQEGLPNMTGDWENQLMIMLNGYHQLIQHIDQLKDYVVFSRN